MLLRHLLLPVPPPSDPLSSSPNGMAVTSPDPLSSSPDRMALASPDPFFPLVLMEWLWRHLVLRPLVESRFDGIICRWWDLGGETWEEEVGHESHTFGGLSPSGLFWSCSAWLARGQQLSTAMTYSMVLCFTSSQKQQEVGRAGEGRRIKEEGKEEDGTYRLTPNHYRA